LLSETPYKDWKREGLVKLMLIQKEGILGINIMKTKPLTLLLSLTFLFLFSGSVFGQEEVKRVKLVDIKRESNGYSN